VDADEVGSSVGGASVGPGISLYAGGSPLFVVVGLGSGSTTGEEVGVREKVVETTPPLPVQV
jgi:hypothetical protein